MKKVLAIAPYPYLPYYSGGQKFIAQFFMHLGKEIDLTVISATENENSLAKTYKTIPLLKKSFSRYLDRSLIKKITVLIKEQGFDFLIIEHPYLAWLAFAIRKRTGIKVIIHTHNIEYQRFRSTNKWWWPILKYYEKWSFRKADALFFITPEDKNFAITQWKIANEKCIDLPFGIDVENYPADKNSCRELIDGKHAIKPDEKILLFAGALNYKPNLDAVNIILEKLNPLLLLQNTFNYKIIICGKGLPDEMNNLNSYSKKNIIYTGFIADIETYYKGADIFLNPVLTGGGVKTKVVEAIAYGTTVVSTYEGAKGVNNEVCGKQLQISHHLNWNEFASIVFNNINTNEVTPHEFYNFYCWKNIIPRIINSF